MLELSDSKTKYLPDLLTFVPGMPVILTHNSGIELGLINGVNGIFRQPVYEVDSVSTETRSNTVNRRNIFESILVIFLLKIKDRDRIKTHFYRLNDVP